MHDIIFVPADDICEFRFRLDKECNALASICGWLMVSMISVRHPGDVYVSL